MAVFGEKKFEIQSISVDFDPSPAGFTGGGNNAKTMIRGDKGKYRIPAADGIYDDDRFLTDKFVEWVYEAEGKRITLSYAADETFGFDLLERKLQDSGMTLSEDMTLNFKASFTPVERSRMYIYVLDKSSGRFADGYKGTSRAESVSASYPLPARDVIPTNSKQVLAYWQGLDTTNKNQPIPGLTFRPGEMITYERMNAAMDGMRGDKFVQFVPKFADKVTVNVAFTYDGRNVLMGKLDVPKGDKSVTNGQLRMLAEKLPPMFALDESAEAYPIQGGRVMVPVVESMRDVTVNYKLVDGTVVGTQVIPDVKFSVESVPVQAPQGYVLVEPADQVAIAKGEQSVDVLVQVQTQPVTIGFYENGKLIGETVTAQLPVMQETVSLEELAALEIAVPEYYRLAEDAEQFPIENAAVQIPVEELSRDITVSYKLADGTVVDTQVIPEVKYSAASIPVQAPQGYVLVKSAESVSITKETTAIDVEVEQEMQTLTITFVSDGKPVGEPVQVKIPATETVITGKALQELQLQLPEGYSLEALAEQYPIVNGSIQLAVKLNTPVGPEEGQKPEEKPDDQKPADKPADKNDPKTGDASNVGAFALLTLASGAAVCAILRKKHEEQ